jgi:hypothetical protein
MDVAGSRRGAELAGVTGGGDEERSRRKDGQARETAAKEVSLRRGYSV